MCAPKLSLPDMWPLAQQDLGHWSGAATTLDQAHQLAATLDDDFVTAQLLMAQGTQALHQGDGHNALALWQRARGIL